METHSSFGEMSLFDNSPRSASAITIDDSLLLKLRVEPLVVLMRQHPDMSLQLIKVLSLRMREANDQIARLTRAMPRQLHNVYDKLQDSDAG
jgi:CRP-like cAMP-binding protein